LTARIEGHIILVKSVVTGVRENVEVQRGVQERE